MTTLTDQQRIAVLALERSSQVDAVTWARTRRAPLWISISLLALAYADEHGESTWERGHLRRLTDTTTEDVSRAITRAVKAGWLDSRSTCFRLVVNRGA